MKTILAALNAKYVHSNLAIRYIKEYCLEYDIELFETSINDNIMDTAIAIIDKEPNLVAFSCYIWNIEATLKVSSIIKEVLPNVMILLGGPEVTFNGKEYLEKYPFLDFIIKGEGEKTFKQFLFEMNSTEKDFFKAHGLIFRNNEDIIENNSAKLINNLDEIPFPYENEIPNKIIYYEASRGCPFNCSYCLSGSDKGVRFFSIDRVKNDLKKLMDKNIELVKFVDRTFNANKRFTIEIWKFLIENKGNTKFHFEIGADLIDDEMLDVLRSAPKDLFQFEIGVQSTNIDILKNINRVMDFNRVKDSIIKIRTFNNIHCHMDLIIGLPGENLESFINSFEECMAIKPEVLQLGFLKVLKGSKVFCEKEKYDIHYIDHPNYQVLYTKDMTFNEIRWLIKFEKVFESYYNSGIFKITMDYLLNTQESVFDFFKEFTNFLDTKDFFKRNLDLKDKFKLLYDYVGLKSEDKILKNIMIHDFVINTKKSVLPEFLRADINKNTKEIINESKSKLESHFKEFDIKKIFAIPCNIKIIKHTATHFVEITDTIVVFNLVNGEYCYLL